MKKDDKVHESDTGSQPFLTFAFLNASPHSPSLTPRNPDNIPKSLLLPLTTTQ